MAQVRFYAMSLPFGPVRTWYANSAFHAFIFQPEMEDADKWRDEYALIAYPVDKDGKILGEKIKLTPLKDILYKAKDRLYLANLPLFKWRLKKFIDEDLKTPISDLLFDPTYRKGEPMIYQDYVSYLIVSRPTRIMALEAEELHPSPPAPPPPGG